MRKLAKVFSCALGCAVFLAASSFAISARATSSFDVDTGAVTLPPNALRSYGFESGTELIGLELGTWKAQTGAPATLTLQKIAAVGDTASYLTTGPQDAIEGTHAFRMTTGTGLVIQDPTLFSSVANGKIEISLWARADGAAPTFQVIYDPSPTNVYTSTGTEFGLIRGIRTGRATDDGWAEFSTGPIDGSDWGVPIIAIIVTPSSRARAGTAFVVDALSIETAPGTPVPAATCTQEEVDTTCGAEGECMFGHCINSALTWGVNPPAAQRKELAERWVHLATHMIGDRNAALNGASLGPALLTLSETALSSRQFLGGMNLFVNSLRDNHTSFGVSSNPTNFEPQVELGSSSTLGACFGIVNKDLTDSTLGYAVFAATANPLSGTPLKPGDLLVAIDGKDPATFVSQNFLPNVTAPPSDAAQDMAQASVILSSLITRRGSVATFIRCASATACDAANQTQFDVDVSSKVFPALTAGDPPGISTQIECTPRFSESATTGDAGGAAAGEDPVYIASGPSGQTWVEFDGFEGATIWQSQMTSVFQNSPAAVLMDAREGHGGLETLLQTLFNLMRDSSQPLGVVSFARGSWNLADTSDMFTRLTDCSLDGQSNACFLGGATGFFATTPAPGAATKVAWLNTVDVSANDFAPRLLQGRTNLRIFSPVPTSGAFGAITSLPSILSGINGSSMQIQDSKFAPADTEIAAARWESSHGVIADEVSAENLSDAIKGTDTMLTRASAWLAEP